MTITTRNVNINCQDYARGTARQEVYIDIDGKAICTATNWAFHACCAAELKNWKIHSQNPLTNEKIDELLECLDSKLFGVGAYTPKEYYFLESTGQRSTGVFELLCQRPEVKLIDSYKNKSHHPHDQVWLWRLSVAKDFP